MRWQSMVASLDRVLRGDGVVAEREAERAVPTPARALVGLALLLGATYGLSLGGYGLFRGSGDAWLQAFASALKVPALFLLTLLVTFPSLYVFAALKRVPIGLLATLRLLLTAIVVHTAVLAGLAPVFAFFAASTKSYLFLLLLNVLFFATGGMLGLSTLRRAAAAAVPPGTGVVLATNGGPPPLAPPAPERQALRLLGMWGLLYGVVGAQMAWLLRPFVGSPDLPFSLFRPREDNVFLAILRLLRNLFA